MRSRAFLAALLVLTAACSTRRAPLDAASSPESRSAVSQQGSEASNSTLPAEPRASLTASSCPASTDSAQQEQAKSRRWLWITLGVVAAAALIYFLVSGDDDGDYSPPGFAPTTPLAAYSLRRSSPVACASP